MNFTQKDKINEKNILNILKNLCKKFISIKLLSESRIGKTLTKLIETNNNVFNPELNLIIKEKAQNLINIWK